MLYIEQTRYRYSGVYNAMFAEIEWMGGDQAELTKRLDSAACEDYKATLNECARPAVTLHRHIEETGIPFHEL